MAVLPDSLGATETALVVAVAVLLHAREIEDCTRQLVRDFFDHGR